MEGALAQSPVFQQLLLQVGQLQAALQTEQQRNVQFDRLTQSMETIANGMSKKRDTLIDTKGFGRPASFGQGSRSLKRSSRCGPVKSTTSSLVCMPT